MKQKSATSNLNHCNPTFEETAANIDKMDDIQPNMVEMLRFLALKKLKKTFRFLVVLLFPRARLNANVNANVLKIICNSNEFSHFFSRAKNVPKTLPSLSRSILCRNWTSSDVYMHKMVEIFKILTLTLNKTFQDEHFFIVFHPCVIRQLELPLTFPSVFQFTGFYRASISIRVDVQPSTRKDSCILSLSTGLR